MYTDARSILARGTRREVATVLREPTLATLRQALARVVQRHLLTTSSTLGGVGDPILAAHQAQLLLRASALDGTSLRSTIRPAPVHCLAGGLVHLGGAPGQPVH